ncbi:MAG: C10 family peptidase [Bacteroidales bacterium]|nr:C10 family peptidase [Bacteroidales bacterium]
MHVHFDSTQYQWDKMTASATSISRSAIAELIYQCGVSVYMNWGYDGSSANTGIAADALKLNFRYKSGVKYLMKDTIADHVWKYTLKEDLDKGHPIIYSAHPASGAGHDFVCDAYQDTSYFHFNWGWGGSNDGYFFLDNLNPNDYEFNYGHAVILNLTPSDTPYCNGTTIYTQPDWIFDDGSGNNYYYNNSSCNWIINPDVENLELIRLTFTKFDLAENDVLKIYKSAVENGGLELIGEYTSINRPPYMIDNWGGDKFYITFETNGEGQAEGWEIRYVTQTSDVATNKLNNINIYPNPAQNKINITGIVNSNVGIYDIYGKLIKEFNNIDSTILDISDMSDGVYFINISNTEGVKTMKFVKN